MFEARLLGRFEVYIHGEPVVIPSRPAQTLLAFLLLNAGVAQRRERLAGLFWPDSNEASARRNLRQALWQARRALGEMGGQCLLADDLTITFQPPAAFGLDVASFNQPLDAQTALADLFEMASAYGGELLPGFYDDWVVLERERLHAHSERVLQLLLERLVALERWDDVLHWGERWIALGATPEPAFRALMTAHAALGDMASMADVYRRCVDALANELAVEPSAQTRALFEQLRSGAAMPLRIAPAQPLATKPRHNLPGQLTSFIGRTNEIEAIQNLLAPTGLQGAQHGGRNGDVRLITLTGPGGTGKTRLALQAAQQIIDAGLVINAQEATPGSYMQTPVFPDGVWLVELALLSDPALVPQTVAAVLEVREEPNFPFTRALIQYLSNKSLLLIMDNCEHLIETCAQFVESILRACPEVKILATSRETLGVMGETVFRVPSLSLPEASTTLAPPELARYEAIRLFVERAAAVKPEFLLTAANAAAITQICRQLDGVPLAIELAAARVRTMTPEQIAGRLDDRFRLLTGGSRTALPRQQTLRATIDWSWDLLGEEECVVLRRLSVFLGGWTLEAAEAVCADSDTLANQNSKLHIQSSDVLELLTHLVEKSLVVVEEQAGAARYYLLETIRQYAREKLLEGGEIETIRARHLQFYVQLAEEAAPQLRSAEQLRWLARLDLEHDNLRAALKWAAGSRASEAALRLAGNLARFWYLRGYWKEGRQWLKQLLAEHATAQSLPAALAQARASALAGAGWLADADGSEIPLYQESLALCRQVGDRWGEAYALRGLVVINSNLTNLEHAEAHLQESLAIFRSLEDAWGSGLALFSLGWNAMYRDDLEGSAANWQEALNLFRQCGDRWGISVTVGSLGFLARLQGNYVQAAELMHESLALFRELGDNAGAAYSLIRLGNLAWRRGDFAGAISLLQESLQLHRASDNQEGIISALQLLGLVACIQGQFDHALAMLSDSAKLAQKRAIPVEIGGILSYQALVYYYLNDLEQAGALFEQSLALVVQEHEPEGVAFNHYGLALVMLKRGEYAQAAEHLHEALRLYQVRGDKRHVAASYHSLGKLAQAQGDRAGALEYLRMSLDLYREMVDKLGMAESLEATALSAAPADKAVRLLAASHCLRQAIGAPVPPVEQGEVEQRIEALRTELGEAAFAAAWAAGAAMSPEQAVALALVH